MEKPKMYFVCENADPAWFVSYGVLSNGFCFGQHICSSPVYAPDDLYFRRSDRIAALKEVFGHEWSKEESELIIVNSAAEVPTWWNENEAKQEALKPEYDKYAALIAVEKES